MGKIVVGEKKPYEYLVKSIENFLNQEELISLMKKKILKSVLIAIYLVELFLFIVVGKFNDKKNNTLFKLGRKITKSILLKLYLNFKNRQ